MPEDTTVRNTSSEIPGELWKRENRTRELGERRGGGGKGGRGGERVESEGVSGWRKRGLSE